MCSRCKMSIWHRRNVFLAGVIYEERSDEYYLTSWGRVAAGVKYSFYIYSLWFSISSSSVQGQGITLRSSAAIKLDPYLVSTYENTSKSVKRESLNLRVAWVIKEKSVHGSFIRHQNLNMNETTEKMNQSQRDSRASTISELVQLYFVLSPCVLLMFSLLLPFFEWFHVPVIMYAVQRNGAVWQTFLAPVNHLSKLRFAFSKILERLIYSRIAQCCMCWNKKCNMKSFWIKVKIKLLQCVMSLIFFQIASEYF